MVWLVNYIPKPIKQIASNPQGKILSLYNSKTSKIICGSGKKLSETNKEK